MKQHLFLAHDPDDLDKAKDLHARLKAHGYSPWLADLNALVMGRHLVMPAAFFQEAKDPAPADMVVSVVAARGQECALEPGPGNACFGPESSLWAMPLII